MPKAKAPSTPGPKPAPYPSTPPASATPGSTSHTTSSATSDEGPITPLTPSTSPRPNLKIEIPDLTFTSVKQELHVPEEGEDELLTPATPGEADGGEKDGDWKPDISVKVTKAKGKVGAKKKGAAGAAGEKSGPKARAKPKGGAKGKVDPGAAGGAGGAEGGEEEGSAKGGKGAKGEYNKVVLLTLIFARCKPDWQVVAEAADITHTQAFDLWRKSMLLNLINGRAWSDTTPAFEKQTKVRMLIAIMDQLKIDWKEIAECFPGRTFTQICDIWRKVIAPRLKRGDATE